MRADDAALRAARAELLGLLATTGGPPWLPPGVVYLYSIASSLCVQMRWHFKNGSIVSVQEVRRGRFGKGQCHANAGWLARRWPERYEWWTGYARIPKFGGFDNHSWVRVVDGPHVEVTYDTPSLFYVGVRVPPSLFSRLREDSSFHPNERVALEALGYDATFLADH